MRTMKIFAHNCQDQSHKAFIRALPSQQCLLHPNGTLLQTAPFRADFYWAPHQRPLGQGAYGTVHRFVFEPE